MTKIRLTLELISPVHVGSGEKLTPIDFFTEGNKYVRISIDRLLEEIKDSKWLSEMLSKRETSVKEIIEYTGIPLDKVKRYTLKSMGTDQIAEIHEHIKNANDQPIIPGSSLKGAIRTALMRYFDESDPDIEEALKEVKKNINQKENRKSVAKPLEKATFISEKGRNKTTRLRGTSESNYDIMRAFQVSDISFSLSDLILIPIKVASLEGGRIKWKHLAHPRRSVDNPEAASTIWVEALKPRAKGEFTIKIDTYILEESSEVLGFKERQLSLLRLEKSFDFINRWFVKVKKREREFWSPLPSFQFYRDTLKIYKGFLTLRLGWGTGLRDTTIVEKLGEDLIQDVRKVYYPRNKSPVFPKTRRIAFQNNIPWMPLGWVRIKLPES